MIRRTILVSLVAVAVFFGFSVAGAQAAPKASPTVVADTVKFTVSVESRGLSKSVNAAIRNWDNPSVVDLQAGDCSGPKCIHVKVVETTLCGAAGGCASGLPDGSCLAEISQSAVNAGGFSILYVVVAHEMGHCMGLPHNDNPTSIMYWMASGSQTITDFDIANLNARWQDYSLAA